MRASSPFSLYHAAVWLAVASFWLSFGWSSAVLLFGVLGSLAVWYIQATEPQSAPNARFWQRQFTPPHTIAQHTFDMCFGIIAPILCVIFDPGVFSVGLGGGGGLFGGWRIFAYSAIGLTVLLLALWLCWSRWLVAISGVIAGGLLSGSIVALLIGVVLAPFSLLLLWVLIGLLGSVPFLTALALVRQGLTALRVASDAHSPRRVVISILVGVALVIGLPALSQILYTALAPLSGIRL